MLQSIEEQFNEVVKESGVKYELNQAMSGHYRLVVYSEDRWINGVTPDYDIIHEDPACEDLYDKETAMAVFIDVIKERTNYKIYYVDNVNEPALLGSASNLDEAKAVADEEASGYDRVLEGDNIDVSASASTARIEVYEGEMVTIVDDEPQLNDMVYATPYFFIK